MSSRRLHDDPGRFGRPIEDGLQRAHDVVPAVEDAQRDDRLAAEQRRRKRFVGDAAGVGRNLVRAEAQNRVAAAALQGDALDEPRPLGNAAGIVAVEEEEPDAVGRGGEMRSASCGSDGSSSCAL